MDYRKKIGFGSAALAALLLAAVAGPARAQQIAPAPPPNGSTAPQAGSEFGAGGWLGVSIANVTADMVKDLKLPEQSGALIADVVPNTPAASAGLRKNDVVMEFDGMKIANAAEFRRMVRETPPGREAQMVIWRDGQMQSLTAQIGQAPGAGGNQFYGGAPPSPNFRFAPGFGPGYGQGYGPGYGPEYGGPEFPRRNYGPYGEGLGTAPTLGVEAENLSGQLGRYFGAPNGEGVLVTDVRAGSPGDKAGLKAGDVILKLDNQQVRNIGELRADLVEHRSDNSVMLDVLRKGTEMSLTVEPQQPQGFQPRGGRIPL